MLRIHISKYKPDKSTEQWRKWSVALLSIFSNKKNHRDLFQPALFLCVFFYLPLSQPEKPMVHFDQLNMNSIFQGKVQVSEQ